MGNCMANQKLNGIIDNQSSYQIIYHISGNMKQLSQFQQEFNVGPKLGVGFQKVQVEGINYNKKKHSKNQKYYSEARVPKHSFCSAGLNNIQIGCFLSIYAVKLNHQEDQVYKKLIFKDICIRTNQDICLRINKDLTVKQLSVQQIQSIKSYFQKSGSKIISTLQQTTDILQSQSEQVSQNTNRLLINIYYLQKTFGSQYKQFYIQYQQTGLFDLNHTDKKIDMKEFLKYDWAYLQSLQLDGCGIDDKSWYYFCSGAKFYFPNLKNLYLADNKITTIAEGDLQQFSSLKVLQLDYNDIEGINPLTQQTKKYLLKFALQHPQVSIYCGNIDENKYLPAQAMNPYINPQNFVDDQNNKIYRTNQKPNWGWYLILSPEVNPTRNQASMIRKTKKQTNNQQNYQKTIKTNGETSD